MAEVSQERIEVDPSGWMRRLHHSDVVVLQSPQWDALSSIRVTSLSSGIT